MAPAISLKWWVVASSKWLAAQAGQTWYRYLLINEENGVAGTHRQQDAPPAQRLEALRQDGEEGHAQQRARAKADQGAQPFV